MTARTHAEICGQLARTGAELVAARFSAPDADWAPVLIVSDGERSETIAIDPRLFASAEGKDRAAAEMAEHVRARRGVGCALVLSSWSAPLVEGDELAPSEREDRAEVLNVLGLDRVEVVLWSAPIRRDATRPPALGPWERASSVEGRYIGPLRRALTPQG